MGADFEDVNRGTPTRRERAHSLLAQLEPYLDALVCYASTIQEHDPNRIVKEIRELLEDSPAPAAGGLEPAREAVACLYTVQGDSQPFMRISRGMLHVAGDIVAVQPLGPLPASPAPAAGGLEAAQVTSADVTIALREWFGGERYARDYEYLNTQLGPHMKAMLEAVLRDRCERAATPAVKPVAWLVVSGQGRRSIIDAQKYDAESDDFWISPAAKAAATITPLYAHPAPAGESAQVKEAEQERDRLAKLVESMIKEPTFAKSPHARMAIAIAASNVRRGRLLTSSEKFDNLTSAIEEDDPDLAARIRASLDLAPDENQP